MGKLVSGHAHDGDRTVGSINSDDGAVGNSFRRIGSADDAGETQFATHDNGVTHNGANINDDRSGCHE